jgi:hypothetical protein
MPDDTLIPDTPPTPRRTVGRNLDALGITCPQTMTAAEYHRREAKKVGVHVVRPGSSTGFPGWDD